MDVDHYLVLGLPSGKDGAKLSKEEIVTAYRRKCKELHPDKRPGNSNAHAEFLKLQESYEILRDETRRKYFDDMLKKINVHDTYRGFKRQRQEGSSSFQERECKRATAQSKAAGYNKFTRIEKFDIDEIRRAVFASKNSYADIHRGSKGVQISCFKDDQNIRVQAFPMEGVWVKLG